ncbi:MAG: peptidylprolyl isomerase [Pseudomonadota bacterium]
MKFFACIAAAAAVSITATAQVGAPQAGDALTLEGIAATVNDQPITYSDVRQRARLLMLSLGAQPTQEAIQQITGEAREQLIDEMVQLQEAAEYDLEVEAEAIAQQVADVARQAGTDPETLYRQLLGAGVNPTSLEDQLRAEIAWRRIMGGLYGSRIRISKNQIDDQFDRLREGASRKQYQLAEMFLFADAPDVKERARQAADSILSQLQQGAPFDLAARQISSAPTAAAGGDMGWVSLEDLEPEVGAAIEANPQLGVLGPIEVDNGYYIMAIRAVRDPQSETSVVSLRQLIATDSSEDRLQDALSDIEACDDIDGIADADAALTAVTLGTVRLDDLNPQARDLIADVPEGGRSEPFTASSGLASMFVCERRDGIEGLPTREQIEDRLYSRELSMISDRTLRNLKREATIIRR